MKAFDGFTKLTNFYFQINYEPGDHVGIVPANSKEIVDGVLNKLTGIENPDDVVQLEILNEKHTQNGLLIVLWKQKVFKFSFS